MSTKIDIGISNSKKPSMVTIHEIVSLTIFVKLDGANYCVWSQILKMHVAGRKKKGYITRKKTIPIKDDPNYDEWEVEDILVKS